MIITAIKSALMSGFLMALLGIMGYIVGVGDIFSLDLHALVNVGVMAFLTTAISLVKAGLTTDKGTALGVQIKDN
jgi:hypothetical protein